MADFDFTVPSPAGSAPAAAKSKGYWLLLLLNVVIIVLLLVILFRPGGNAAPSGGSTLNREQQLELAQRLERQGLTEAAVEAWQEYLRISQPDPEKAAKLWYRIGMIQQDGRLYEQALASYYRSESLQVVDVLTNEISRRTQECLMALGKVAGLRRSLEERTSMTPSAAQPGDDVLAEIGSWKITRGELERLAEQMIDMQLAAPGMPPEQAAEQKKTMLKNLSNPENLQGLLAQVVQEELLYREAREQKVYEQDFVRQKLQQAERGILASAVMRQRLGGMQVSDADVKDFFIANQEMFREPAAVRLAHIQVADSERAKSAIASITGGTEFADLAKSISQDAATAEKSGEIAGWLTSDQGPEEHRALARAVLARQPLPEAGALIPEPVQSGKAWHVVKVLEVRPAATPDLKDEKVFAAARDQLLARKQRDIQMALMQELSNRYQVVWHRAASGMQATQPPAAKD
ncbi:MAG: peptidyl-prolyl cis-trans isomerase [Lentisphaeria bacterium]|jgi:peptidyl-prolyl cis-trans isomerase C